MSAGAAKRGTWQGERVLVLSPTPTHPQDYGNRKRIFQVCSHLQSEGAEITYVHYPSEAEWRRTIPWEAEHAMKAAWPQYFTVPPSRGLHMSAKGEHHFIDEWWDESIGTFLHWLFSVQSFDSFIVNYAWLSRAFEFAPPSVARILDTHDKKSGRRELLEKNGIAPEYFFTTEDQEAIALNRAHLVWAIKDEERVAFERIGRTPSVALPHLDPLHVLPRPIPDPDGYLRVGFLAARNSINHVNIKAFLQAAEPLFRETFAPVKIVVAGSICDLFDPGDTPFVELRGRVADVDAFYRSVDCVAIPMTFSTGLKIKTGEAISAGLPVISTAHAFEGYEPADPMHTLEDHEAVARALVDLSFAPRERLDELATASLRSHAATAKVIQNGFTRARALIRDKQQSIVLAVDSRALVPGSVFNLVLKSVHDLVRALGAATVFVVKGSASDLAENERTVDQFGRVVVASDLTGVDQHAATLAKMRVDTVDVEHFLADKGVKVLIADALHPAFESEGVAGVVIFARTEMIALSEGGADFSVPAEHPRRVFIVSPSHTRAAATAHAGSAGSMIFAPCFNRSRELTRSLRAAPDQQEVVLFGTSGSRAMTLALALAASWRMKPRVVGAIGGASGGESMSDYIGTLVDGQATAPTFAIDLSGGAPGVQLCSEILERHGVPVIRAGSSGSHPSFGPTSVPIAANTEFELFEVFRAFAQNPQTPQHRVFLTTKTALETDRGWTYIWSFCKQLFETQDAEFA